MLKENWISLCVIVFIFFSVCESRHLTNTLSDARTIRKSETDTTLTRQSDPQNVSSKTETSAANVFSNMVKNDIKTTSEKQDPGGILVQMALRQASPKSLSEDEKHVLEGLHLTISNTDSHFSPTPDRDSMPLTTSPVEDGVHVRSQQDKTNVQSLGTPYPQAPVDSDNHGDVSHATKDTATTTIHAKVNVENNGDHRATPDYERQEALLNTNAASENLQSDVTDSRVVPDRLHHSPTQGSMHSSRSVPAQSPNAIGLLTDERKHIDTDEVLGNSNVEGVNPPVEPRPNILHNEIKTTIVDDHNDNEFEDLEPTHPVQDSLDSGIVENDEKYLDESENITIPVAVVGVPETEITTASKATEQRKLENENNVHSVASANEINRTVKERNNTLMSVNTEMDTHTGDTMSERPQTNVSDAETNHQETTESGTTTDRSEEENGEPNDVPSESSSSGSSGRIPEDVDPLNIFVEDITYQRFPQAMSLTLLKQKVIGRSHKKIYILEETNKKLFSHIRQLEVIYTLEDDTLYANFLFRFVFSRKCQEIQRFRLGKLAGKTDQALFEKELPGGKTERVVFFTERPDDYVYFMSCTDRKVSPYACRDTYYVTLDSARDPPNQFPWAVAADELNSKMNITFEDPRFVFNLVLMPCARP